MICKKCGKEFEGNVCPNCESYYDVQTKEFRERPKLSKTVMALVIILVAALIVAIIVPTAISLSNNIFRVEKVNKINIGDSQEQVVKILGEPNDKSDNEYEYYTADYELIKENEATNSHFICRYIRVEFDEEKKVSAVLFDAKKSIDDESRKTVSSYELITKSVMRFVATDIVYSAKFTDGSFYKGVAVEGFTAIYSSKTNVAWFDKWKIDYQKLISVKENPNIKFAALCGNAVWYAIGNDNVLTVCGDGAVTEAIWTNYDDDIEQIVISDGVTNICDRAFFGYENLKSATLPSSLISIGSYAFAQCYALESITIPNSVRSIDEFAFFSCNNLTIFCETESLPSGWAEDWNYSNCPTVWDCAETRYN